MILIFLSNSNTGEKITSSLMLTDLWSYEYLSRDL